MQQPKITTNQKPLPQGESGNRSKLNGCLQIFYEIPSTKNSSTGEMTDVGILGEMTGDIGVKTGTARLAEEIESNWDKLGQLCYSLQRALVLSPSNPNHLDEINKIYMGSVTEICGFRRSS